jgi:hypothetical protein
MDWLGPLIIAAAAVALFLDRRQLAAFQANILGGSIAPGCVVAEAVLLLILAAVMLFFGSRS